MSFFSFSLTQTQKSVDFGFSFTIYLLITSRSYIPRSLQAQLGKLRTTIIKQALKSQTQNVIHLSDLTIFYGYGWRVQIQGTNMDLPALFWIRRHLMRMRTILIIYDSAFENVPIFCNRTFWERCEVSVSESVYVEWWKS